MKHLVVYVYNDLGKIRTGSVDCKFVHNPPTMTDIRNAEKEICEKFGNSNACIVNWLPISEENDY